VKTVTTTEAKAKLNALLADVERTGASVTITNLALR
jgi:prevent-host-death family protein